MNYRALEKKLISDSNRFGYYLVSKRIISLEQLLKALAIQKINRERNINLPVGSILVLERYMTKDQLDRSITDYYEERFARETKAPFHDDLSALYSNNLTERNASVNEVAGNTWIPHISDATHSALILALKKKKVELKNVEEKIASYKNRNTHASKMMTKRFVEQKTILDAEISDLEEDIGRLT